MLVQFIYSLQCILILLYLVCCCCCFFLWCSDDYYPRSHIVSATNSNSYRKKALNKIINWQIKNNWMPQLNRYGCISKVRVRLFYRFPLCCPLASLFFMTIFGIRKCEIPTLFRCCFVHFCWNQNAIFIFQCFMGRRCLIAWDLWSFLKVRSTVSQASPLALIERGSDTSIPQVF